jgi:hypothetical protein
MSDGDGVEEGEGARGRRWRHALLMTQGSARTRRDRILCIEAVVYPWVIFG